MIIYSNRSGDHANSSGPLQTSVPKSSKMRNEWKIEDVPRYD